MSHAAALERVIDGLSDGSITLSNYADLTKQLSVPEDSLELCMSTLSHLNGTCNSDAVKAAYEKARTASTAASTKVGQSSALLQAIQAWLGPEGAQLTEPQHRVVASMVLQAQLSGCGLDEAGRARVASLKQSLSKLGTDFSNNVISSVKEYELVLDNEADLVGMTDSLKSQLKQDDGTYKIGAHPGLARQVLTQSENRSLRQRVHQASLTRASEIAQTASQQAAGSMPWDLASSAPQADTDVPDVQASSNVQLLQRILAGKQAMSQELGYPSYAHVSTAKKMSQTPQAVIDMLDMLYKESLPAAQRDLAALTEFAHSKGFPQGEALQAWDISYWMRQHAIATIGLDEEEVRQYLPLDSVLNDVFGLIKTLFGVEFEKLPTSTAEDVPAGTVSVWDDAVLFYVLRNPSTGKPVAGFYLDPLARPAEKRSGAWVSGVCNRAAADVAAPSSQADLGPQNLAGPSLVHDGVRLPVAQVVLNAAAPGSEGGEPHLGWSDVVTLLHELGHGLQFMLTQQDDINVAGISGIEWDAVELPSQFMEHWALQAGVISTVPVELLAKLKQSQLHMAGYASLRQLQFATLDMDLHLRKPDGSKASPAARGEGAESTPTALNLEDVSSWSCGFDPAEVYAELSKTHSVVAPAPYDRFLCQFNHIFGGGYAAGYYSYKWAEVMAADAFAAFKEAAEASPLKETVSGPAEMPLTEDNVYNILVAEGGTGPVTETAQRFMETVLAKGGGRAPGDVWKDFRGREPDPTHLLADLR